MTSGKLVLTSTLPDLKPLSSWLQISGALRRKLCRAIEAVCARSGSLRRPGIPVRGPQPQLRVTEVNRGHSEAPPPRLGIRYLSYPQPPPRSGSRDTRCSNSGRRAKPWSLTAPVEQADSSKGRICHIVLLLTCHPDSRNPVLHSS